MRVWVNKCDLKTFKEYQDEGRTLSMEMYTFRTKDNDSEIEVKLQIVEEKENAHTFF